MTTHRTPSTQFGRTASDLLAFLEIAQTVQVSVRINMDWPCRYLEVKPEALINSVAELPPDEPMPSEYQPATGYVVIGSVEAIHAAMTPEAA